MEKPGLIERINAGAPIPSIEPSQLEYVWEQLSRIRRDTGQDATLAFSAFKVNPEFAPKYHDEHIALSLRVVCSMHWSSEAY